MADKQSIYLQIAESVKRDIRMGFIKDGDRLPSCRELAIKMGINPNTVQRAYSELEKDGYIETVPKKGVYARASAATVELEKTCERVLVSLKQSGMCKEKILEVLDRVFEK